MKPPFNIKKLIERRMGRPFGTCDTCGKPTRSHLFGTTYQCHTCFAEGERIAIADGGEELDEECFRNGCDNAAVERFGNNFICADCIPDSENVADDESGDASSASAESEDRDECRWNTTGDHENPYDVLNVSDEERAQMLQQWLDRVKEAIGKYPRLLPVAEEGEVEGKGPIIQQLGVGLNTQKTERLMVHGWEAVRQIREEGARGFCAYAGRLSCNTEDVVFCDHDEPDEYPTPTGEPTLEVMSGSGGQNAHETYINAGDVKNSKVGDDYGEIRADNQYVVTPGSVHPSGGVYHIKKNREIATLSEDDLSEEMLPNSAKDRERTVPDHLDPTKDADLPDDETEQQRLDKMFESKHGDTLEKIWNGRWHLTHHGDRSSAEVHLICALDSWVAHGSEAVARRLMNRSNAPKWNARDDDGYRRSLLDYVGSQDWYYDPAYSGSDRTTEYAIPPALADTGWDWREGSDNLVSSERTTLDKSRKRTQQVEEKTMEYGNNAIIPALPGMGKSRGTIEAVAETGVPVTVYTSRHDLYDQYAEWCQQKGLSCYRLPSLFHDCPSAAGEHGDDYRHRIKQMHEAGATPKDIHAEWDNAHPDDPLPCQCDGTCTYSAKWGGFSPEDFDVLIGNYQHMHLDVLHHGRMAVIDEFPGTTFDTTLGETYHKGAVTSHLQRTDEVPFDSYADLMDNRDDGTRVGEAILYYEDNLEPETEEPVYDEAAHALAPHVVFTILTAEELDNGWKYADLPDGSSAAVNPETYDITIRDRPNTFNTRGVMALDGTPDRQLWYDVLGRRLDIERVLDDEERKEYIESTLGIDLVLTTDNIRPYSSGKWVDLEQDRALLEEIARTHGEKPAAITTKKAEKQYKEEGLFKYTSGREHYGNLKGSNRFKSKRLAAVIGSRHFGDRFIKKWAALRGMSVEPNGKRGQERSYGRYGDRVLNYMRESQTLQAVLRFGRDGDGAVVYVHTNTLPDWVPLAAKLDPINTHSKGMLEVVEAARERDRWTAAGIAAEVSISRRQVLNILDELAGDGYIDVDKSGSEFVWTGEELHHITARVEADLSGIELGEDTEPVEVESMSGETAGKAAKELIYTWNFHQSPPNLVSDPSDQQQQPETGNQTDESSGPPPGVSD